MKNIKSSKRILYLLVLLCSIGNESFSNIHYRLQQLNVSLENLNNSILRTNNSGTTAYYSAVKVTPYKKSTDSSSASTLDNSTIKKPSYSPASTFDHYVSSSASYIPKKNGTPPSSSCRGSSSPLSFTPTPTPPQSTFSAPKITFKSLDNLIKNINNGWNSLEAGGYIWIKGKSPFTPLFKGKRFTKYTRNGLRQLTLEDLLAMVNSSNYIPSMSLKDVVNNLTSYYKIHLMPKNTEQLYTILKRIGNDQELINSIQNVKIKEDILELYKTSETSSNKKEFLQKALILNSDEIFPIIVIYPSTPKEQAQLVLNKLYQLFRTMEGLNITPRYNTKVTSLIYYAQGDGDHKKSYPDYYINDNQGNPLVFYNVAKLNKVGCTNLKQQNMPLKAPDCTQK